MKRLLVLLPVFFVGCDSSARLLETAPLDPAQAAQAAIAQYDTDSDGKISSTEAKASALDPKAGWDADGDNSISEEEIRTRLERYEAVKPGIMGLSCTVIMGRTPLDGATVVFEPEEFLGGSIEAATGTTDINGVAVLSIPEVVAEDPALEGIRTGLYKVKITHPTVEIPAKFNEETTLVFEASPIQNIIPPTFRITK